MEHFKINSNNVLFFFMFLTLYWNVKYEPTNLLFFFLFMAIVSSC